MKKHPIRDGDGRGLIFGRNGFRPLIRARSSELQIIIRQSATGSIHREFSGRSGSTGGGTPVLNRVPFQLPNSLSACTEAPMRPLPFASHSPHPVVPREKVAVEYSAYIRAYDISKTISPVSDNIDIVNSHHNLVTDGANLYCRYVLENLTYAGMMRI